MLNLAVSALMEILGRHTHTHTMGRGINRHTAVQVSDSSADEEVQSVSRRRKR